MNDKSVLRSTELRLETAMDGVNNFFPATIQDIVVNGQKLDKAGLLRVLDAAKAPWRDARIAHATLRQFTQDKPEHEQTAQELLAGLEGALIAHYGRSNEELTKFGFKPFKRRQPATVVENTLRAAKAKLTREKRGTLGKKQREAIKAEGKPSVSIDGDGNMTVTE